jgi:hypothetical protein
MARFHGTFEGHTTGGVTVTAGGVLALAGAAVVLAHPHQAAEALSGAVTVAAIVTGVLILAAAAFVFVRLRRRASITVYDRAPARPGIQWQQNPNALPAREARAIAPAIQTVINNFGADATAAYLREQAVPVYRVTAEQQEIQS